MPAVDEIKQRLTSRFMAGHAIFAHLDAGEFDKAADIVRAKYAYEHPLEAAIRNLNVSPPSSVEEAAPTADAASPDPEEPTGRGRRRKQEDIEGGTTADVTAE